jgi:hypothetical protein
MPLPRLLQYLALCLIANGCADSAQCDDDQVLENDVCVAAPMSDGDGDAAMPDATLTDAAGADADNWGDPCSDTVDHSECTGPADFCSVSPGDTEGYCSAIGCADDEGICPDGWGCLDLSIFAEGLPSVCTEPMP